MHIEKIAEERRHVRRPLGVLTVVWLASQFASCVWSAETEALVPKPIRVLVWDERQPEQKSVYPNWLGNHLADQLQAAGGIVATSMALDDPEQGLSGLDHYDVVIWWGHVRHREVKTEAAKDLVKRLKSGQLSLIALHASHWSKPFVEAMNARARAHALAG